MLSNNHILKVQSQYFKQLEQAYFAAGVSTGNILMSLREMFVKNPQLCKVFADETFKVLKNLGKVSDADYQNSYELLAHYGVLMSGVVFGCDYATGRFQLYTSSINVLKELAQKNILKPKKKSIAEEIEAINKKLYLTDGLKKAIKTGNKVLCVRLDTQLGVGGKLQMTATMPKTAPTLDSFIFAPFDGVKTAWDIIYQEAQGGILRIDMEGKIRYVTMNQAVLASIYGEARAKRLTSILPDIYTQRFYLPSLGASKYTLGVTNIHVESIDSIGVASLADIDLSEVNMNYTMVKPYCRRKLAKISKKNLGLFAESLGLDCLNAPEDNLMERVLAEVNNMSDHVLWDCMKKVPAVFKKEEYDKMRPIGKKYDYVDKPQSIKQLNEMLDSGIYKIVSVGRSGKFSTMIVTNNKDLLSKTLGSDYVEKYESLGVRTRYAKRGIESGANPAEVIKKYRIEAEVDEYPTGTSPTDALDAILREVEYKKTVVKQSHLVTARNVQAYDNKEFYKNVDITTIHEMIQIA